MKEKSWRRQASGDWAVTRERRSFLIGGLPTTRQGESAVLNAFTGTDRVCFGRF
jgi:hypothetical protein